MPFTVLDLFFGGVIPAVVAGLALVFLRRVLPRDLGQRYSATIAVLIGFTPSFSLLKLAPWVPSAHWHWLPYTLIGTAILGPVASARGLRAFERWLLLLFSAAIAGWVLVPTWEDLSPSRSVYLFAFVVYAGTLAGLLEPLSWRVHGPLLPAVLWATMTSAAVVLALAGSLRFAQIALAGASPIFGLTLVACLRRNENWVTGFALSFSVMAAGSLLIGRVNSFSEVPLASYTLVPLAPLPLWICSVGPLSRLTGVKRFLVHAAFPIAILASAIMLALFADLGNGGGEY